MAVSRNARRMAAKKRANMALCEAANNAAIIARRDVVRDNLSRSPKREHSTGLVSSLYSGNANPAGYTRPLRWSHGVAK